MRRYMIITALLTLTLLCHAQGSVGYSYDAAGNRISRTIILSRNMAKRQSAKAMESREYTDRISLREVRLSPNPTQGLVKVSITGMSPDDACALNVHTMGGQLVEKKTFTGNGTTVDLSGRPDGIYLLDITVNGEKTTWKIIKK